MSSRHNVKLLLTDNVENLGIVGDIVEVRPGYARNYLLPHALATTPTPGAVKKLAARRAEVEKQLREKRAQQEALIAKLEGYEVTIQRSANEQGILFGSVTQHDIAVALQEDGFNVTERDVRIGTPIKQLDSYTIPVALDKDLRAEVKLWVVSDKPAEQLETEKKAAAAAEAPAEQPADEAKPEPKAKKEKAPKA